MRTPLASIIAFVLLGTVVLTGCGAGDVIDPEKTQIALQFDVLEATGQEVETVRCPSDVPVTVGNRFTCLVVATNGDEAVAELEVISDQGDLRVLSLERP